jgi:ElaB/YqjD/DUF883 family membrane-anchored ribosome-binding protein
MKAKDAIYAAVGAPIAVAKDLNSKFEALRADFESRAADLSEQAQRRLDEWAKEGREAVSRLSEGKVVDELTSKVDFDHAREQVTKLRDQLEDMLATWRSQFRPVEEAAKETVAEAAEAVEEKAAAAKKTATKTTARPATKATAQRKPTAKADKPAAKASGSPTTKAS